MLPSGRFVVLSALFAALTVAPCMAQELPPLDPTPVQESPVDEAPVEQSPTDESPEAAAERLEALGQFDLDGDGQLLNDELGRARAFLRALRETVGDRPRGGMLRGGADGGDAAALGDQPPQLNAPEGRRPRRGPRDQGPPRPAGDQPSPAGLMAMFDAFDGDQNGQLNRDEFLAVMGELRGRRDLLGPPNGPPRDRERRLRGGDGFGGPDEGDRGPRRERGDRRDGDRRPTRDDEETTGGAAPRWDGEAPPAAGPLPEAS